jgi:hypothetical protein
LSASFFDPPGVSFRLIPLVDREMKYVLTKRPSSYSGSGRELADIDKVIGYDVRGLPAGEEAHLKTESPKFDNWKIHRIKDNKFQLWGETYKTADDALAALQKEYDS